MKMIKFPIVFAIIRIVVVADNTACKINKFEYYLFKIFRIASKKLFRKKDNAFLNIQIKKGLFTKAPKKTANVLSYFKGPLHKRSTKSPIKFIS